MKILITLFLIICYSAITAQISTLESQTQSINFDGVRNATYGNSVNSEICDQDIETLHIGDLWIAGLDPSDNLKAAVQYFGQQGSSKTDFYKGPILDSNQPLFEEAQGDSIFNSNFVVRGEEVRKFISDFETGTLVDIPDAILYWPARGNPNFFDKYNVTLPLQELAPFYDQDGDGLYDPEKGDYPITKRESPKFIPYIFAWSISNDIANIHRISLAAPLNIEVHTMLYFLECDDYSLDDKSYFINYKIINKGFEDIRSGRIGFFTLLNLMVDKPRYIWTNTQKNSIIHYYQDYSVNKGDFFCSSNNNLDYNIGHSLTFIDKPIFASRIFSGPSNTNFGQPMFGEQFYNSLSGFWNDGSPLTRGGIGINPNSIDTTKLIFTDPPYQVDGWSCQNLVDSLAYFNFNSLASIELDILSPGASFSFEILHNSFVAESKDPKDFFDSMISDIDGLTDLYNNGFRTLSCNFLNSTKDEIDNLSIQIHPNPFSDYLFIDSKDEILKSTYKLIDVFGREIRKGQLTNNKIETADLPSGTYYLSLNLDEEIATFKIVKR